MKENKNKRTGITILSAEPVTEESLKKAFKEKEFNLSEKEEIDDILSGHGLNKSFRRHIISLFEKKEKEFIKKIEKECGDAQMYADMDDETFWRTSTISPQEAQKRADYYFELLKKIHKLAGEKLI